MKISTGYYGIFDMVLALRQIYSKERFKPFNESMNNLVKRISNIESEMIDKIGDESRGWLKVIEMLIDDFNNGIKTNEEILIKMKIEPKRYYFQNNTQLQVFINLWSNHVSYLMSQNMKEITDSVFMLAQYDDSINMLAFITGRSDRINLIDNSRLKFNIKPDFEIKINDINSMIIMPSVFATRKITFWHSNGDFIIYVSLDDEISKIDEPSENLLLTTLAINDKTRLKMLKLLAKHSQSVNDLAQELSVNPSTISRHMKVFKDSGFVDLQTKDKNSVYYSLNKIAIKTSIDRIFEYITDEKI